MPQYEDNQQELNRVKSMMSSVDIESRVIPPQPRLVENYTLDKVMTRILWQPNGVETVLNIMQKTEIDFDKYKNSFIYLWVFCGPVRLGKLIDERFKQNPITEDLSKLRFLYDDPLELALCRAEIKNRKTLELKTGAALQTLGAAIALQQAKNDAEIQVIKDNTKLDYLQRELKITNEELHDPNRQHELIRSSVDAMGQFLVKRSEALALDDRERRNIQYQLNLLNGIRNGDVSPEQVRHTFNEFRDIEMNSKNEPPKSANDA